MRLLVILGLSISLVLGVVQAMAQQVVLAARNISYSETPRSEFGPQPDNAYIWPKFQMSIGNAPVTDSLPDSELARIFSSIAGQTTKAVAITAQVDTGPQIPLLIISRDGNKYSQQSGLTRDTAPALMLSPGSSRQLTIAIKSSNSFNSTVEQSIADTLASLAPMFGGVPAALLSPEAKNLGASLDKFVTNAFTTVSDITLVKEVDASYVKGYRFINLTFFDGAANVGGRSPEIATLKVDLTVLPSLVGTRDQKTGKFVGFEAQTALNAPIGGRTVNAILQQSNLGAVMGQITGATNVQAFNLGCQQIRAAISSWGVNEADNSAVFYSALSTLRPLPAGIACPTVEERVLMERTYGLPQLTDVAASVGDLWTTTYLPFMGDANTPEGKPTVASAIQGSNSFATLVNGKVNVSQSVEVIKGFPVGSDGKDLSAADLDALFKKGVVTKFSSYKYDDAGKALVESAAVSAANCSISVTLERVLNDNSQAQVFLKTIRINPPLF